MEDEKLLETETDRAPLAREEEEEPNAAAEGLALLEPDGGPPRPEDGGPPEAAPLPAAPVCLALCPAGEPLETVLEALLFSSAEPVPASKLAEATGRKEAEVEQALRALGAGCAGRAFELVEIAGGYQIMTRPAFHGMIQAFKTSRSVDRLSASALETLAIIAYKQPIIRAEIEAIRGVQCGPVLRGLLDRRLVRVAGRDKRPGNPILYRTSSRFLEHFGLSSLKDLPSVEELRAPVEPH